MFIHAVPDNKGKKYGYYCSLMESCRIDRKTTLLTRLSFGFVSTQRLLYLKATFNEDDPTEIFEREQHKSENKKSIKLNCSGNCYGREIKV